MVCNRCFQQILLTHFVSYKVPISNILTSPLKHSVMFVFIAWVDWRSQVQKPAWGYVSPSTRDLIKEKTQTKMQKNNFTVTRKWFGWERIRIFCLLPYIAPKSHLLSTAWWGNIDYKKNLFFNWAFNLSDPRSTLSSVLVSECVFFLLAPFHTKSDTLPYLLLTRHSLETQFKINESLNATALELLNCLALRKLLFINILSACGFFFS